MNLDQFIKCAKLYKRVMLSSEIDVNSNYAMDIFKSIKHKYADAVIFEDLSNESARYCQIAFGSFANIKCIQGAVFKTIGNQSVQEMHDKPLNVLRNMLKELYCFVSNTQHVRASIIGFVSYDAVQIFENALTLQHASSIPQFVFNFYTTTLYFDCQTNKLFIDINIEVGPDPKGSYMAACKDLEDIINMVNAVNIAPCVTHDYHKRVIYADTDVNDEEFKHIVLTAKRYIEEGDAFQIVLSRVFNIPYHTDPLEIYKVLREHSPSPYMFYLTLDDMVILGASPERLVGVHNRVVSVNPIAGTRKRENHTQDEVIAMELLNDPKECAEHMMLVDLARNDVGVVAAPGSVHVTELMKVKHFSHVSHICSTVTGVLRDDLDCLDAIEHAFPAGTLSGAPKIRAMEIIDELESTSRGLYGGAICRMDYLGNLDSCIAIRMATLKDGVASVRTGAGIVFDSDPQLEADETRHKAQAMLNAIYAANMAASGHMEQAI